MLKTSLRSVMQLLIDVANNKFDGSDYGEDIIRILLIFFMSKDPTATGNLTFNGKKTFNFLWHAFI